MMSALSEGATRCGCCRNGHCTPFLGAMGHKGAVEGAWFLVIWKVAFWMLLAVGFRRGTQKPRKQSVVGNAMWGAVMS